MSMLVWIIILIASTDGALVYETSPGQKQNMAKCNSEIATRNVEDIATEVAVLQTKLQSMKAVATLHAKLQSIEATSDLMKEIATLQPKMQAKEATNDIQALKTKIEAIEGKLEAAARADRIKTTQIEALQNKNAVCEKAETQTKAIEDILQQVASLQAQLQESDFNKTTQITNLKAELLNKTTQLANLQSTVHAITGSLSRKQPITPLVGFHVSFSKNWGGSGKVPFDKIISNYGNGWNNITHVFNVPTKGLYFLILTVMNSGGYAASQLMRGSTPVARAYASNVHSGNVGTVSTVLLLDAGEHVYAHHASGTLHSGSPDHYTYLAGFLIRKSD